MAHRSFFLSVLAALVLPLAAGQPAAAFEALENLPPDDLDLDGMMVLAEVYLTSPAPEAHARAATILQRLLALSESRGATGTLALAWVGKATALHFYLYPVVGIGTTVLVGMGLSMIRPQRELQSGLTWWDLPPREEEG